MTYSEKLKDPRWQKKRLEILERDNWTCLWCGHKDDTLHVHHVEYIKGKEPWDYDDAYYQTTCNICHSLWHSYFEKFGNYPSCITKIIKISIDKQVVIVRDGVNNESVRIIEVDSCNKGINEIISIPYDILSRFIEETKKRAF